MQRKKRFLIVIFIVLIFVGVILIQKQTTTKKTNIKEEYCVNSKNEAETLIQLKYGISNISSIEYSKFENNKYVFIVYFENNNTPFQFFIDKDTCEMVTVV